jgi:ribosomal protein S18 acetylase RimI-like enzyme
MERGSVCMKTIQKPWIKLKETIDHEDYDLINKLQEQCTYEDKTVLKLELDYKRGLALENGKISSVKNVNEFMFLDGEEMIGYIGICSIRCVGAGAPLEVNGMVRPEYRRQGIFTKLSELAMAEWKQRNSGSMLLLSDRKSNSGQNFIKGIGAQYKHSEYEMYLREVNLQSFQRQLCGVTFRKATNADAREIARQNEIYFNNESQDVANIPDDNEMVILTEGMILPEEEEKRGITTYLAEKDQHIIGKVRLELNSRIGGIYGLGVLPEHRGQGGGRAILMMAIEKLKEMNVSEIMLQVATENANALNLYKSCGFMETSIMDYYEMKA